MLSNSKIQRSKEVIHKERKRDNISTISLLKSVTKSNKQLRMMTEAR